MDKRMRIRQVIVNAIVSDYTFLLFLFLSLLFIMLAGVSLIVLQVSVV